MNPTRVRCAATASRFKPVVERQSLATVNLVRTAAGLVLGAASRQQAGARGMPTAVRIRPSVERLSLTGVSLVLAASRLRSTRVRSPPDVSGRAAERVGHRGQNAGEDARCPREERTRGAVIG